VIPKPGRAGGRRSKDGGTMRPISRSFDV